MDDSEALRLCRQRGRRCLACRCDEARAQRVAAHLAAHGRHGARCWTRADLAAHDEPAEIYAPQPFRAMPTEGIAAYEKHSV